MDFVVLNRDEEAEIMLTSDGFDKATVTSAVFHEEIDGLSTLDLEVAVTIDTAIYVKEENIIGFHDMSGTGSSWNFFVIKEVKIIDTVPQRVMEVHCEDYAQELIDTIYYREQKDLTNTVPFMVTEMLSNTRWEINPLKPLDNPAITSPFPEETKLKTSLGALQTVASVFGLHLQYEFQYFDRKIQHRYMTMKAELGSDNGVIFDYDINISEIERTIDSTNVKTAIVPYGKEVDGNLTTISNVVWTKPTNPANKPAGSAVLEDTEATAIWGFGDGTGNKTPRYLCYENSDIEDPNELIKIAWEQLQTVNTPKVNYKLKIMDLYALSGYDVEKLDLKIKLGDIVRVVDRAFLYNTVITTHIVSRDVDLLDVGSTEIELGSMLGSIVQTTSSLSGLTGEANVMNLTTGLARLENNVTVLGDGVIQLKEDIGDPSMPINYNWIKNSEFNNGTRYWIFPASTGSSEIDIVTGIPFFTMGIKLTNNAKVRQTIVGIEKFIGYDITLSVFAKNEQVDNTGHFNIYINYIETDTGTAKVKEIQSPTFNPLTTDWQRYSFTTPIVKEADMQTITSIIAEFEKDDIEGTTDLTGFMLNLGNVASKYIKNPDDKIGTGSYDMIKAVNNANFESGSSYVYIEEEDGIWVYDKPNNDPENPPTKAVVLKGGMLGIATWDSENNEWNIGAFINGQSVNADYINAGTLSGDRIAIGGINQEKLSQDIQTILSSVSGKADVSWVTQELTARDGVIALKVSQTDLENAIAGVQSGSINVLERTNDLDISFWNTQMNVVDIVDGVVTFPNDQYINSYLAHTTQDIPILPLTEYTFSCKVKTDNAASLSKFYLSGNQSDEWANLYYSKTVQNTEWEKITYTFTTQNVTTLAFSFGGLKTASQDGHYLYVKEPKIELGNVATAYNIPLEETRDNMSDLKTRVSTAEQKITPSAIVSTVRSSTEYVDDLGQKITSAQATSIAQTAENIKIGFNSISDRVVIADTGLTINNNNDEAVLSADSTGNLVVKGKITAGGSDRIELDNGVLTFFQNNIQTKGMTAFEYPIRLYMSNYRLTPTGSVYSNSSYSKGLAVDGKVITQWFTLNVASSIAVGDYAVFNNLELSNWWDKDCESVGAVLAFSLNHEVFPAIVNWTFDATNTGDPVADTARIRYVNVRLRNITQTTQAAGNYNVCLVVIGNW